MKKVSKLLFLGLFTAFSLTACSKNDNVDSTKQAKENTEKIDNNTDVQKEETSNENKDKTENNEVQVDDNEEAAEEENPNENVGNDDLKAGNTYAEVDRFIEHKTYEKLKLSDFTHLEEVDMPSNGDEKFGISHKFKLKDGFVVVRDLNGKVTRIKLKSHDTGEEIEINDQPPKVFN